MIVTEKTRGIYIRISITLPILTNVIVITIVISHSIIFTDSTSKILNRLYTLMLIY